MPTHIHHTPPDMEMKLRSMVGAMQGFGSYRLVTFDAGRTWWSVEEDGAAVKPADPKLLERIRAFDALADHARRNGPIGSRPITQDDVSALENAGFGVAGR